VVTVTITVIPINDAPVAVNDAYSVNEDTTLTISAPGVLANDTDVDSTNLTVSLVSGVGHGTLTFNSNGSFTYVPVANYFGTDTFPYRASDGSLQSNTATVTITVNNVNDRPVVTTPDVSGNEGSSVGITATFTDADPGDTHTATIYWGDGTNNS